jgi:hypothetical protein
MDDRIVVPVGAMVTVCGRRDTRQQTPVRLPLVPHRRAAARDDGPGEPGDQAAGALIDHLRQLGRPVPVFLLIGGGFNMYVGRTRRAPRWVRRLGGEWFFRFLLEPRRLFRRYFIEDMRFLSIAAHEFQLSRATR